jgi:CubicO group peptidase (beta-lactamase class C family)
VDPTQPHTEPAELDPRPTPRPGTGTGPQWSRVFADALAHGPGGYAYCVMKGGVLVSTGSWGFARMPADTPDGLGVPFGIDTRCNLASVSKTVTATALFAMVAKDWLSSVNDPFWPILAHALPGVVPASGVATVTLGELLMMLSRLPEDGTLYLPNGQTVMDFVGVYVEDNAVLPRQGYVYSNTNFTILQAVISAIAASNQVADYVDWVRAAVLTPLGIDTAVFSPVPDDQAVATLTYDAAKPQAAGYWWPPMQCVGPGGWIASARTLATYLAGISSAEVLGPELSGLMMQKLFGWYHAGTHDGLAYHHNGGLTHDGSGLSTGVVRFPDGSDAVLLSNKVCPGIIALMVEAYETGG